MSNIIIFALTAMVIYISYKKTNKSSKPTTKAS